MKLIHRSTCTTCRKARALLQELGFSPEERDTSKSPLTAEELDALIGSRDYLPFLNPRNDVYRERGMRTQPPLRDEAIRLMAETPTLLRRPLLLNGDEILFGFDEAAYRGLTGR